MSSIDKEEIRELLEKYSKKIDQQINIDVDDTVKPKYSSEYKSFRKEFVPRHLSLYEKACNVAEKIMKFNLKEQQRNQYLEDISIAHLNITPEGAYAFSFLFPIAFILFGFMFAIMMGGSMFFLMVSLFVGLLLITPLAKIPNFYATSWRMKASNQMVLCIFYVVTYMRHTSNLELALHFASEHLAPPLSVDLRKVLWDVETEKYESIKESLDAYLETWRKYNLEFIEAFHLIESSLYEASDERRLTALDKSLDVILSETYEKMLHYAHNLKSPITMLHMLGVILPILGLVILPLVVSFMDNVTWYHIATLYNVILPLAVYYLGRKILSMRPTGYGDTDISEENPELKKYKNLIINIGNTQIRISPLMLSLFVGSILLFVGLSPIIIHNLNPSFDISFGQYYKLLEYRESKLDPEVIIGPFGLGASILSIAIPAAFGLGIGLYYKYRSQNVIKIRETSKKLEEEFGSALFQLGNRLGDGYPAEIAFEKVAVVMEGTVSGNFFSIVSNNIRKLGVGVKEAIFNPKLGALVYFPSSIIESSMKVLIESVKKGPQIAAQALTNISRYIKEIHQVNERLKDLMADIISSMKSQAGFLTPVISGIVVGITSMITSILGRLSSLIPQIAESGDTMSSAAGLMDMFGDGVPTYFFQFVVGIYVVQIIYILTVLTNGIENGSDKLNERYSLGQNLVKGTLIYSIIAAIVILLFNFIAGTIMMSSLS